LLREDISRLQSAQGRNRRLNIVCIRVFDEPSSKEKRRAECQRPAGFTEAADVFGKKINGDSRCRKSQVDDYKLS
jgi:hypothetical protein